MAGRVVVVFADGPGRAARASLPPGASVIAADGGAEEAHKLGLAVDLVIGDLDSLSPATLAALEQLGTRVERHPVAKDASDLELALDAALALEPARIVVVGGGAGRLDHHTGELLLLAADAYASVPVDAQLGVAAVHVVRGERTLAGMPGELVSLFAVHGPAAGVVTEGLRYPLRDETLAPGSTRGLSNVFAAAEARVSVERGVLLVVRPNGSV
jgi:thiamine pyrophosphokinase